MSRIKDRLRKRTPGRPGERGGRDHESRTIVIPAKAGIPGTSVSKQIPGQARDDVVVCQAAALVLAYPEAELLERLDVIEAALTDAGALERFLPVLTHLRGAALGELQAFHVQEFDLSRRHALHLSYWTDGDTRRRGEVLASIKAVYRESGLVVDAGGELPDHLPMVLEFAAVDPGRGFDLLNRFRASLELIRLGLVADVLPHAGVLEAVCGLLPGASPRTRAEVQARFGDIQPMELVGLDQLDLSSRSRPANRLVEPVETPAEGYAR